MDNDRRLFMGAGDHSMARVGKLYQQLGRAISTLGSIQQHPMESEEACRQYEQDVEDGEIELEQIAREIYMALTGILPPRIKPEQIEEVTQAAKEVMQAERRRTIAMNWALGIIIVSQLFFFLYLFFVV